MLAKDQPHHQAFQRKDSSSFSLWFFVFLFLDVLGLELRHVGLVALQHV